MTQGELRKHVELIKCKCSEFGHKLSLVLLSTTLIQICFVKTQKFQHDIHARDNIMPKLCYHLSYLTWKHYQIIANLGTSVGVL